MWTIPTGEFATVLALSFTAGAQPEPEPQPPTLPSSDPEPPHVPSPFVDSVPEQADPQRPRSAPSTATSPPPDPPEPEPSSLQAPLLPPAPVETERSPIAPAPPPRREQLLRPSDKLRFFSMSAGGATGSRYASYYGGVFDFQLEGAIGRFAKNNPNYGGAFVLQYRKGLVSELALSGRFVWDKPLSEDFAIYSSFDTTLGITVPFAVAGTFYAELPAAQVGVGWGIKAILADRFMLFLRPISPNLVAPDRLGGLPLRLRWDVGGGIGVVW